jgi:hypothetical protein
MTSSEGRKILVRDVLQSPFVTGITAVQGGAKSPNIVVLDEGTVVEVTVAGRQPAEATVDVTVEQSWIGDVKTKEVAPGMLVQVPKVDIHKKRVIDFVKFGAPLVIPLRAKGGDTTVPRVELVIGAGEEIQIPLDWTGPLENHRHDSDRAERAKILNEVLNNGAATIRCDKVSRWEESRGRALYDELDPLPVLADCVGFCRCLPHPAVIIDLAWLAASILDDRPWFERLEEGLLGHDWVYSVELVDSPALAETVHLLSSLSEVWNLRVTSKDLDDYGLLHMLAQVNVRHELDLKRSGPASAGAGKQGWLEQRWRLRHESPGRATLALEAVAQLFVDEAESAIPALKAAANLKSVLITAEYAEDRDRAERIKGVMQKALPQATITTFVFEGAAKPAGANR